MKAKDIKKKIIHFVGLHFLYYAVQALLSSVKVRIVNKEIIDNLLNSGQNFVIAFWHGTMLIPWAIHKNIGLSALISQSADGELLARLLKKWGYSVERGSSHVGGKEALQKLLINAGNNQSIALTPDGPRGPKKKMKAGAIIIAKKTQIPLVLAGVFNNNKYVLKSWDKFEIPKLFSKSTVIYSKPIFIDEKLSFEETNKIIIDCENKLNKLHEELEKT